MHYIDCYKHLKIYIMITRNTKFNRLVFLIVMIIAILWAALEIN